MLFPASDAPGEEPHTSVPLASYVRGARAEIYGTLGGAQAVEGGEPAEQIEHRPGNPEPEQAHVLVPMEGEGTRRSGGHCILTPARFPIATAVGRGVSNASP